MRHVVPVTCLTRLSRTHVFTLHPPPGPGHPGAQGPDAASALAEPVSTRGSVAETPPPRDKVLREVSTFFLFSRQVYIRIKDDEWNIYRRYTEFRSLHHKLQSKYPQVRAYSFPPKKAIGNKVRSPRGAGRGGPAPEPTLRQTLPFPFMA